MISKRLVLFCCACITVVMLWPAKAAAQYRVHHPAARSSVVFGVGVGFGYPYYYPFYSPFYSPFYGAFYSPFWYGGYPYGPYPYYYGPSWPSARIEVKPNNAQVYLDGYYVGVVDQFDGIFQRLDVPSGEHELTVYLPGHRSYTQKTLFRPGEGYHFKGILEPLAPGAPEEPAPKPSAADPYRQPAPQDPYGREPRDPNRPDPRDPGRTRPLPEREGERRAPESGYGTLNIRVLPGDAVVVIDGERWDSPEGGSRLMVELTAGSHRVEVRKDGYKTYTSTLQIRAGEPQTLNVSLTRQE